MEISALVIKTLSQHLDVDPALIKPETRIVDDLGADSLMIVELVLAMEEQLEMDISDEEVFTLGDECTVALATAFVEKKYRQGYPSRHREDEPTVQTHGVVTGRMSSSGPNYNNMPREDKH